MEDSSNNCVEKPVNSKNERVELLVGTKGVCFLCLEQTSSERMRMGSNGVDVQEVCLRNVCRFLQIKPHYILKQYFNDSLDSLPENLDKLDFSVMLCKAFAGVTEKLSELIRQLELTTMLMNEKMRQFNGILERSQNISGMESGSSGDRWKDVKEAMMAECEENRLEVQLVENLRKEAATKCLAKVQQIADASYPKVCLQKLDVKRISQSQNSTTEEAAAVVEHTSPSSPLTEISPEDAASSKTFVTQIARHYLQKLPTGNRFRCLKCKSVLYGVATPKDHVIASHPETLFTHLKLPNVSDEEFNACCKYALKPDSVEPRDGKKKRGNVEVNCSHCKQKCHHSQHLSSHLVMKHYKALERKITSVQRSENILSIIKKTNYVSRRRRENISRMADNSSVRRMINDACIKNYTFLEQGNQCKPRCSVCKKDIPGKTNPLYHLISSHPEKLFTDCKLSTLTEEEFVFCCKHALATITTNANITLASDSTKFSFECQFCKKQLCHKPHLRYHLVTKHYQELRQNILQLQETGNLDKIMKTAKGAVRSADRKYKRKCSPGSNVKLRSKRSKIETQHNTPYHGTGTSSEDENMTFDADKSTNSVAYNVMHTKVEYWVPDDSYNPAEHEEMESFANEMMLSDGEDPLQLPAETNVIQALSCSSNQDEENQRNKNLFLDNRKHESPIQIKTEFVHARRSF